jgi:hypothetical protein
MATALIHLVTVMMMTMMIRKVNAFIGVMMDKVQA